MHKPQPVRCGRGRGAWCARCRRWLTCRGVCAQAQNRGPRGNARGARAPPSEGPDAKELAKQVEELSELLKTEREERNYYQLERDKLNTFWEVTKKDLEEAKAALRNKDRELEELEESHQVQLRVYKQKVRASTRCFWCSSQCAGSC